MVRVRIGVRVRVRVSVRFMVRVSGLRLGLGNFGLENPIFILANPF